MMTNHRYSQDESEQRNGVSHEEKPKMSRAEERHNERIGQEAKEIFEKLANKYMDAFTLSDNPEGEVIAEFGVQLSKQWRTYCKRKGLVPQLYGAVDAYVKSVSVDYQKIDEPEPSVEPVPEPPTE